MACAAADCNAEVTAGQSWCARWRAGLVANAAPWGPGWDPILGPRRWNNNTKV
jgi:hypothetical protein